MILAAHNNSSLAFTIHPHTRTSYTQVMIRQLDLMDLWERNRKEEKGWTLKNELIFISFLSSTRRCMHRSRWRKNGERKMCGMCYEISFHFHFHFVRAIIQMEWDVWFHSFSATIVLNHVRYDHEQSSQSNTIERNSFSIAQKWIVSISMWFLSSLLDRYSTQFNLI